MQDIAVVAAMKAELEILLSRMKIYSKKNILKGTVYTGNSFDILRTGIGVKKCTGVFRAYLEEKKPSVIINIGLAGALDERLSKKDVYLIEEFAHRSGRISSAYRDLLTKLPQPKTKLLTVDYPILNTKERRKTSQETGMSLVDMEAYHLSTIAQTKNVPFLSIKVVSDYADKRTIITVMNNINLYAAILADHVEQVIQNEDFRSYSRL